MIVFDRDHAASMQVARRFRAFAATEANCIVVIGGDGTMLAAVREHWRLRLPFFGINTGHRGFMLNEVKNSVEPQAFMKDTVLFRLPLLNVEYKSTDGIWHTALAFNDAWLERATGQTARIEVRVNKIVRIPSLFADGVLVATPTGSTAYARAMGATPLPVDTPALVLVGSNVADPDGWRSKNQSLNDVIEFTAIEREKRPVKAMVDGLDCGLAEAMSVRVSRAASVELVSARVDGFAHKWMSAGFPKS
jgi:NAD kinase